MAHVWTIAYIPIVLVTMATAALSYVNFTQPYWTPARSFVRIAIHGLSAVVFMALLRSGPWVVARSDVALSAGTAPDRVAGLVNTGFEIGLFVAFVVSLVEIAREVHRWQSRQGRSSTSDPGAAQVTR